MKLYVVEKGEYEGRNVAGIYSSLQKAMDSDSVDAVWRKKPDWVCWHNGMAEDDAARITVHELDSIEKA